MTVVCSWLSLPASVSHCLYY